MRFFFVNKISNIKNLMLSYLLSNFLEARTDSPYIDHLRHKCCYFIENKEDEINKGEQRSKNNPITFNNRKHPMGWVKAHIPKQKMYIFLSKYRQNVKHSILQYIILNIVRPLTDIQKE